MGSKEPIDITLPSQPTSILLSRHLLFTLSPTSKLHVTSLTSSAQQPISLSQQPVTSFTLTSSFLIFTTTSHFAHFAPLTTLEKLANGDDDANAHELKWEERRVERGAKIVVASESEMSLVLQATRGNLETVYPRPMVLQVVKRDVLASVLFFFLYIYQETNSGKKQRIIPCSILDVQETSIRPQHLVRPGP